MCRQMGDRHEWKAKIILLLPFSATPAGAFENKGRRMSNRVNAERQIAIDVY